MLSSGGVHLSVSIYQIHIMTDRMDEVKSFLVHWLEAEYGGKSDIFSNQDSSFPFFTSEIPTHFALCEMHDKWITILHDSYDQLIDLTSRLSSVFNTLVIHTLGQSTVDTYHVSIFQKGRLLRKMDVGEEYEGIEQYGEPFPFERNPVRGKMPFTEEGSSFFDYHSMQDYCLHFNIDILIDPSEKDGAWEVIQLQPEPESPKGSHNISFFKKFFLAEKRI